MKVLLSVVVPVFNAEKYLKKCIESILNQTFPDFELILINDGSIDTSREVCESYCKKDNRVRLINQLNTGPSQARNRGIVEAKGDFLLFVDADDYVEAEMFQFMFEAALKEETEFLISGLIIDKFSKGTFLSSEIKKLIPRNIMQRKNISNQIVDLFENEAINGPCGKLYNMAIIREKKIKMNENIHLQEDLLFNIEYLSNISSIYVTEKCFYHYQVQNENSLTRKYTANRLEMLNQVHEFIVKYFLENSNNENNIMSNINYLYVKNVYSAFLDLFHESCSLSKKEKKNFIKMNISSKIAKSKITNARKSGMKYKFLLMILKINNAVLVYYFCKLLNYLRNNSKLKY